MRERKALTIEDRVVIYGMRRLNLGIREIARTIGRSPSVVSRELKRNSLPRGYGSRYISAFKEAYYADFKAKERLKKRRRVVRKCHRWNVYGKRVLELLIEGRMSPEQISVTLDKEGIQISASTIYRFCTLDTKSLRKFLPRKGKSTRRAVTRSRVYKEQRAPKKHISERSVEAKERSVCGHYEMDTIHSKRGTKGGILSVIDRWSREKRFIPLEDLTAHTTRAAMVKFFHSKPQEQRLSVTLDNGSEFEQWEQLEKIFPGLQVYFCDPYASYQKGSVERANQDFRRFIPKGTDISRYSPEHINAITEKINAFPLKILGNLTPAEFQETRRLHAA